MTAPFQALIASGALPTSPFPPTSRYHGVAIATLERPGEPSIRYVLRRFVPPPDATSIVQEHRVVMGDRIDNLAARYLGDPELFWRIADANGAMRPEELLDETGRRVDIALPGAGGAGA